MSELIDSDLENDWTVVSSGSETTKDTSPGDENEQNICGTNKSSNSSGIDIVNNSEARPSHITLPEVDDDDDDPATHSESSLSSGIDVIDDNLDEHLDSALPTFLPESSSFSFSCPSDIVIECPTVSNNLTVPEQIFRISPIEDCKNNSVHDLEVESLKHINDEENLATTLTSNMVEHANVSNITEAVVQTADTSQKSDSIIMPVHDHGAESKNRLGDEKKVSTTGTINERNHSIVPSLESSVTTSQIAGKKDVREPIRCNRRARSTNVDKDEDFPVFLGVVILVIILGIPMLISYKSPVKITDVAKGLKNIEDEILKCIGSQRVDAANTDDSEMLNLNLCADNSTKLIERFKHCKNYEEALSFLLITEKSSSDHSAKYKVRALSIPEKEAFKGVDVDLILRQLAYSGFLPLEEDESLAEKEVDKSDTNEEEDNKIDDADFNKLMELEDSITHLQQVVENLTLENKELKTQILLNNEEKKAYVLTESEIDDLKNENLFLKDTLQNIISKVKSRASPFTVEFGTVITETNNDDSEDYDDEINELKEGINNLLFENDDLKKEIAQLRYVHTFPPLRKENTAEFHIDSSKDRETPEISVDLNKVNEHTGDRKMNNAQNMATEELNFVAVLNQQIEKVHSSFTTELLAVKKFLMQNMDKEAKHDASPDKNKWSWQDIKKNVQGILFEAHNDLTEKMSSFQNLNVSDVINNYISDNKKNLENMLNFFDHYFKVAQEKTQKIFEKQRLENSENTVSSMWNVFGRLKEKWSYVKAEFQKITKTIKSSTPKTKRNEHKTHTTVSDDQNDDAIIIVYENEETDNNWKKYKSDVNPPHSDQDDDFIIENYDHEKENEIMWNKYKAQNNQPLDENDDIIINDYSREYEALKEQPLEADNVNWYFKKAKSPKDMGMDSDKIDMEKISEDSWLFERAAYREKHRKVAKDLPPNWFLRKQAINSNKERGQNVFIEENYDPYPGRKEKTHNRRNSHNKQENAWSNARKDNHYR